MTATIDISKSWWTYFLSFIPGQAGLMKIHHRHQLDELYFDIGSHSMCGLYFIPNEMVTPILQKVKLDRSIDFTNLFVNENNFFLLTVDFDYHGGNRDGELFYRELICGSSLDEQLKLALLRTE